MKFMAGVLGVKARCRIRWIAGACAWLGAGAAVSGSGEPPAFERTELFPPGERDGQRCYYRIPKLVVSAKGTVFAFPEERVEGVGDEGRQNVVVRRSFDGGRNWGVLEVLKTHANPRVRCACAGTVADLRSGRVFLVYGVNVVIFSKDIAAWEERKAREGRGPPPGKKGRFVEAWCVENPADAGSLRKELVPDAEAGMFIIHSDDEGVTWSEPKAVRVAVRNPVTGEERGFSMSPSVGIQIERGMHRGRLVMPGRGWVKSGAFDLYAYSHNFVALSDDGGETWRGGGLAQTGTGEACVAELADGGVYLNSRNESLRFRGCRAWDRSDDGGESFVESGYDRTLVEPHCHASIVRYSFPGDGEKSRVLFCNPAVKSKTPSHFDDKGRRNLTVRISYDECRTWPVSRVIDEGGSGYSSLAVAKDGTVLCLYEASEPGRSAAEGRLVVARFNIEWLSEGNDRPGERRAR